MDQAWKGKPDAFDLSQVVAQSAAQSAPSGLNPIKRRCETVHSVGREAVTGNDRAAMGDPKLYVRTANVGNKDGHELSDEKAVRQSC
jgi:hypothetical protein